MYRSWKEAPQGFTRSQFSQFSRSLRKILKSEGLPDGELLAHGSRVSGTSKVGSDIDVILRVSDEDFWRLASKRLAQTTGGNRKAILKTVRNQQRLRMRGISETIETKFWDKININLPDGVSKIQFSIVTEGSSFNIGPYMRVK